jgi:hypothetical protein
VSGEETEDLEGARVTDAALHQVAFDALNALIHACHIEDLREYLRVKLEEGKERKCPVLNEGGQQISET